MLLYCKDATLAQNGCFECNLKGLVIHEDERDVECSGAGSSIEISTLLAEKDINVVVYVCSTSGHVQQEHLQFWKVYFTR